MKVEGPHWPRWYSSVIGHWGYLREVRQVDREKSEDECRSCGWTGQNTRVEDRGRAHWLSRSGAETAGWASEREYTPTPWRSTPSN
jgi:hypothetical protein